MHIHCIASELTPRAVFILFNMHAIRKIQSSGDKSFIAAEIVVLSKQTITLTLSSVGFGPNQMVLTVSLNVPLLSAPQLPCCHTAGPIGELKLMALNNLTEHAEPTYVMTISSNVIVRILSLY